MEDVINRRLFPRRQFELAFDLVVDGKPAPAVVTDYSLSGISIFIKGKSDLKAQVLDFNIREIDLNATGKIIWKRELLAGLQVGVVRMGPLEGRLYHYRLSDIVTGLQRSRSTGILNIETELWRRKIYFKEGEMVFSSSDQDNEQLGAILLAAGRITPQQYQKTLSLSMETGRSQGGLLVEMKYIEPQELVQNLQRRVEAVITNLCNMEDARFTFTEEPLPLREIVPLKLNSSELLYRGSINKDCLEIFRRRYLHQNTKIYVSPEMSSILDSLELQGQDRDILALLNGKTLLKELFHLSPLKEEDTLRSVYALFNARLLEVEAAGTEENKPQEQETATEEKAIDREVAEKIESLYFAHEKLGYYGVLGLQPGASTAEIKSAYHAMAKQYHPDRYIFMQSGELREKLNVIFAYINEAYRTLSKAGSSMSRQQPQTTVSQQETVGTNTRAMALGKYRQGRQSLDNQDDERAMTLLGQAVYLDESVAEYHFYYGMALLRNRKIKEAETSIRKAVGLSPHNADYISELGQIYLDLGFVKRAKSAFDKALRINPAHKHASEGMKKVLEHQEISEL